MIENVFVCSLLSFALSPAGVHQSRLVIDPTICLSSFLLLDVSAHLGKQTERRMKSQCKGYALIGLLGELCERQAEIIGSVKNIEGENIRTIDVINQGFFSII